MDMNCSFKSTIAKVKQLHENGGHLCNSLFLNYLLCMLVWHIKSTLPCMHVYSVEISLMMYKLVDNSVRCCEIV
jgi:hypothetical protein